VEDAYTQYGLVGVVLTSGVTIEQWVMSCRVLGYQVEVAVRDMVVAALRKDSDTLVYGRLVKTEANSPCRDLFAKCGFVVADTDRWVLAKDKNVSVPPHVTMRSNGGIIG
jgi:predicted enzyme involved in methoxymalonyl-ACP biosynthesis